MTPRENMKRVLSFSHPERIGFNFFLDPAYPDDMVTGGIERRPDFDYGWHEPSEFLSKYSILKDFHGVVRHDEQGNLWGKLPGDFSDCGEVLQGVLQDWEDLKTYQFPHLADPKRFANCEKLFAENLDKFRLGMLPGFPFAIMRYMRKMEIFLEDLILEPENVALLTEIVTNELIGIIDNYADIGCEGIFTCEDWGTQDRLLISPKMWRDIFKPVLRKIFDHIHKRNMYVLMHSCGYIWEILPDLIEIGVDSMQLDQPTLMGIERLADLFKGKVTLFSPVDIQRILPTGDRTQIEKGADEMIRLFGSHGGGLIAKDYGDYKTLQINDTWACWMRERFIEKGRYI